MRVIENDVRHALERFRGRDVRESTWNILSHFRVVAEVLDGADDLDYLAKQYRSIEEDIDREEGANGQKKDRRVGEVVTPDERILVLSSILAKEAAQNPDVASFRREILGEKPLDPADVLTARKDGVFAPESLGKLTRPVDITAWEALVRRRFDFLSNLDADEQRWATCDPRHRAEVDEALAAGGFVP